MLESVDLVKVGRAPRIKQDESKATYEGRCGADNARIDWGKPWQQIDRVIRGCNPAPGAWTMLDGKTLKVFEAKPLPAKDPKGIAGKMGEVVEVAADASRWSAPTAASRSRACRAMAQGRGRRVRRHPPVSPPEPGSPDASALNPAQKFLIADFLTQPLDGPSPMPASQHQSPKSDIEIAQAAKKRPIMDIAREKLGIAPENLEPYGHYKAKLSMDFIKSLKDRPTAS